MNELQRWFSEHGRVVRAEQTDEGYLYVFEDGAALTVRNDPTTGATEIVDRKLPEATKADTPSERHAAELEAQRRKNAALPRDQDPAYETDAERAQRARQTRTDQEAEQRRQEAARQAEETRERSETQRRDTQVINTQFEADGTKVETYASGRVERAAPSPSELRAAQSANRPTLISPGATRRSLTTMGPGGELSTIDNPEFDQAAYDRAAAQEQAKAERDRLSLMIQAGQLSEQTAAAQYKRWFDENVTVPLQRAQEARARATELRQAQEAEDRRQQFAATYEQQRSTTALSAGQAAASAFNQNLQYQVGPAFGEQFAGALNSLRGGPAQEFTADAFQFRGPAIEEVARKATAQALSQISPYAKAISTAGNRPLQVAEYDQSMMPAAGGGGGAPPPAAVAPDYAGLVNSYLQQAPYAPGPPAEEEEEAPEE